MKEEDISVSFFEDWFPDPKKDGILLDIWPNLPDWTQSLLEYAADSYEEYREAIKFFEELHGLHDPRFDEPLTKKQAIFGRKQQAAIVLECWRAAAAYRNAVKSLIGGDAMTWLRELARMSNSESRAVKTLRKLPPPTLELNNAVASFLEYNSWIRRLRQVLKQFSNPRQALKFAIPGVSSVHQKHVKFSSPEASAHRRLGAPWPTAFEGPTASESLPKIVAEQAEPLFQAVQALHEFQRMSRGYHSLIRCLGSKRSASQTGFEILAQMVHRLPETLDALEDAQLKASRAAVFAARMNSSYLDDLVAQAHGEFASAVSFPDGVTASVEEILTIDQLAKVYFNLTLNESNMLNDSDFEVNDEELLGIGRDLCASNSSLLAFQNGSIFFGLLRHVWLDRPEWYTLENHGERKWDSRDVG